MDLPSSFDLHNNIGTAVRRARCTAPLNSQDAAPPPSHSFYKSAAPQRPLPTYQTSSFELGITSTVVVTWIPFLSSSVLGNLYARLPKPVEISFLLLPV
jgi:hypothetical protein